MNATALYCSLLLFIGEPWGCRTTSCAMRLAQVLVNGVGINVHVWISVHMVFNIRGYIFLRLWNITVHTRPCGDLDNLAIEKCTARDLKITLLHSASHGVLDLVALTCLTSWMHAAFTFVPHMHWLSRPRVQINNCYQLSIVTGTMCFSPRDGIVW